MKNIYQGSFQPNLYNIIVLIKIKIDGAKALMIFLQFVYTFLYFFPVSFCSMCLAFQENWEHLKQLFVLYFATKLATAVFGISGEIGVNPLEGPLYPAVGGGLTNPILSLLL